MFFSAAQTVGIGYVGQSMLNRRDNIRTFITNNNFNIGNAFELFLDAFGEDLFANYFIEMNSFVAQKFTHRGCHHIGRVFHEL